GHYAAKLCVERHNTIPVGFIRCPSAGVASGDGSLNSVGARRFSWLGGVERFCPIQGGKTAADQQLVPAASVLIEQQDWFARGSYTGTSARSLNLHQGNKTVDFRLMRSEFGQNASQAQSIFAKTGPQPVIACGGRVALVEDEINDFQDRRDARGKLSTSRNFKGDSMLGKGTLGADNALRNGGLRRKKCPRYFLCAESPQQPERQRHSGVG